MELFDLVNNLYTKRQEATEKDISGKTWIINKFISMDKDLLEIVAHVSKYIFTLGNKYYTLLDRIIPISSLQRNKYIKIKKEYDDELLNRYKEYFKVSKRETREYLSIMIKSISEEEIYNFVGLEYNTEKKNLR